MNKDILIMPIVSALFVRPVEVVSLTPEVLNHHLANLQEQIAAHGYMRAEDLRMVPTIIRDIREWMLAAPPVQDFSDEEAALLYASQQSKKYWHESSPHLPEAAQVYASWVLQGYAARKMAWREPVIAALVQDLDAGVSLLAPRHLQSLVCAYGVTGELSAVFYEARSSVQRDVWRAALQPYLNQALHLR